jgi:hypothetical protein
MVTPYLDTDPWARRCITPIADLSTRARAFRDEFKERRFTASESKGNCYDNAMMGGLLRVAEESDLTA